MNSHLRIEKVEGVVDRYVVWLNRDNKMIGWIVRHPIRTNEFAYQNSYKFESYLCYKCLDELSTFVLKLGERP